MFRFVNKMKNRKGFTLVELVVVIAILGILAAIAVPRLLGFQERAEEQADKQTAVQIRNALSLLHANGEIEVDSSTSVGSITYSTSGGGFSVSNINFVDDGTDLTQAYLEDLTGNIDVVGTKDITVTLTDEGVVTVTSP